MPWLEPAIGAALLLAMLPGLNDLWQVAFVLPIVLPLLAAPLLVGWLDQRRDHRPRAALPAPPRLVGRAPARAGILAARRARRTP
jgi:hypothetical protein